VIYENAEYKPYPIRHEAVEEKLEGGMQKIAVHIPNILRQVQAYMEFNDGLRGRKVTLILVNKPRDDTQPLIEGPRQTFVIEASSSDERIATFVLGKPIPVNEVRIPGRIITRDLFPSLPGV
jgi:phage-related protein